MPYLNLDLDFHDHPKVKRLTGLLGRGAEGLLTRLWCYCGKHHCVTGILTGYSGQEVESIIGWWGKPGVALEALMKLGFLEQKGSDFVVHDWLEHSGHLAALKERGRANARKRWDKVRHLVDCNADRNATSIPDSNAPQDGEVGDKDSSLSGARKTKTRQSVTPKIHPLPQNSADLAQLFAATYTGTNVMMRNPVAIEPFFAEMVRGGHSIEKIAEWISSAKRSWNESTAQFEISGGFSKSLKGGRNGTEQPGPGRIALTPEIANRPIRRYLGDGKFSTDPDPAIPGAQIPGTGVDPGKPP